MRRPRFIPWTVNAQVKPNLAQIRCTWLKARVGVDRLKVGSQAKILVERRSTSGCDCLQLETEGLLRVAKGDGGAVGGRLLAATLGWKSAP